MAKDPAVLWYFNDWSGGTITLSRHLKGCYMDLLHAQFNSGPLSLDEIKTVLGSDFGSSWPTLQKKFLFDSESGLYANKRLIFEADRRKNYTASRSNNRQSKKDMSIHMSQHMEIDTETINSILPNTWDKTEFFEIFTKWFQKRKKKPDTELSILRISELIAKHPAWPDAKAAMKEAALEGWIKFVYKDKNNNNQPLPEGYGKTLIRDKA